MHQMLLEQSTCGIDFYTVKPISNGPIMRFVLQPVGGSKCQETMHVTKVTSVGQQHLPS